MPRPLLSLCLLVFVYPSLASRHNFATRGDHRLVIGPIGTPFGFTTGGEYNLTVYDFELKSRSRQQLHAGFILKRFESESEFFATYKQELKSGDVCAFEDYLPDQDFPNDDDDNDEEKQEPQGIFLSVDNIDKSDTPRVFYKFESKQQEGLYVLMYQVCGLSSGEEENKRISSSFELDLVYKNYDKLGYASYLTAGEMPLPMLFLYFCVCYALCLGIWFCNIRKIQAVSPKTAETPKVYAIHHLMTVLLILKTVSVLLTSIRYHYIRISGHADLWSVVYYTLYFIKGTFLFTVILLIGSGWSFVKPFLTPQEKKVVFLVLLLQVLDNVALVVLNSETEGESWYNDWSALLHLVDIVCCCAVLIPIVWHVKSLEKSLPAAQEEYEPRSMEEQESVRTLEKLRLFRSFYLVVVGYIYFTRIVVYMFSTMLGYQHTWIRYLVTEFGTLLFYITTGILFQPMADNPYLALTTNNNGDPQQENNNNGIALEMGKLEINIKD